MNGQEMKDLRIKAGLLGVEVAERLGVSGETVSRWERGKYRITTTTEMAFLSLVEDGDRVKEIIGNRRIRRVRNKRKRNTGI